MMGLLTCLLNPKTALDPLTPAERRIFVDTLRTYEREVAGEA
jgi:hypothetical protein